MNTMWNRGTRIVIGGNAIACFGITTTSSRINITASGTMITEFGMTIVAGGMMKTYRDVMITAHGKGIASCQTVFAFLSYAQTDMKTVHRSVAAES